MRGRDQWVLIQAVIDHLGQDVHASYPIAKCMMNLEWPMMQGTVGSVGPLSLFRSLSGIASLLILDMGTFFPSDGYARISCSTWCGNFSFKSCSSLSLLLVESFSKRAYTSSTWSIKKVPPARASMCSLASYDNPQ
jgi:hypothetical protein